MLKRCRWILVLLGLCLCLEIPALAVEVPLYVGVAARNLSLREVQDREAPGIAQIKEKEKLSIYSYTPAWLDVEKEDGTRGYVLRQHVVNIEPVDPETMPYGSVVHRYTAVVSGQTDVFETPDLNAVSLSELTPGTVLSIIRINDGWAEVAFQRQIGYVHASLLRELTPISPTVEYALPGELLASYTSYYATNRSELNVGRMVNIEISCDYISLVMQPGDEFSFNGIAGPYRKARGYLPAPVLIDGTSVPGFGGGTCQVSSTLYNVLLQLPDGIEVLRRRPHGPAGARYLPHGVDAAVGNENLDLAFRNDFPFPIRIEAGAQDGAICISIYKEG